MKKIIFLIVNWDGLQKIQRCLRSLRRHLADLSFEVLVIDNGSTDGSCDFIKKEFPQILLLENSENIGFARACNQGLEFLWQKKIPFDYIVFMNNDVELKDGSLARLFQWMEEHKEVTACLPAVLGATGVPQTGVGGYCLSLTSAFFYFFFLSILFPKLFKGLFFNQHFFYKKKRLLEVDWLSGACLVVRKSGLEQAGGFPVEFFMYAEDLAFGEKLRHVGKMIYYPEAQVYHLQDKMIDRKYPARWLDSLFGYYWLSCKKLKRFPLFSISCRLRLFLLKLIFLAGFIIRFAGYSFLSILSFREEFCLKKKEMAFYANHTLGSLFSPGKG